METLNKLDPVEPLQFNKDILIDLPNSMQEFKDPNYINQKAKEKMEQLKSKIFFFKDYIKDPETSVLLMIVDDYGKNAGKKRLCLLTPDFKYIGINCKFIENNFIAIYSFSK